MVVFSKAQVEAKILVKGFVEVEFTADIGVIDRPDGDRFADNGLLFIVELEGDPYFMARDNSVSTIGSKTDGKANPYFGKIEHIQFAAANSRWNQDESTFQVCLFTEMFAKIEEYGKVVMTTAPHLDGMSSVPILLNVDISRFSTLRAGD